MKARHETLDHRVGKQRIAQFWRSRGYATLFEEARADVAAFRLAGQTLRIIASEFERSPRNIIQNVLRNFEAGASVVLIVVLNAALQQRVRRLLRRELSRDHWTRVAITTQDRIVRHTRNIAVFRL